MNRVLFCHIVPRNLTHKFNVSQAQNNFCYNLLDSGVFDKAVSMPPLHVYFEIDDKEPKVKFHIPDKKYTGIFGKLWRYISQSFYVAYCLKQYDSIWFYNIFHLSILVFLLLKYVYRKNVYVIMTDHTPARRKISIQSLIKYQMEHCAGMINLSKRSTINNNNITFISGIVPSYKIKQKISSVRPPLKVLFSGTLSKVTGIQMALAVFKKLPDFELHISGCGKIEDLTAYPNIHYHGMCSFEDYNTLLSDCDICLNFRNPHLPENLNNFPSKMLEYLSCNKIVVSTIKYPELEGISYLYVDYNEKDIINLFRNIEATNLSKYQDNRHVLYELFSEKKWSDSVKMIERNARNNE